MRSLGTCTCASIDLFLALPSILGLSPLLRSSSQPSRCSFQPKGNYHGVILDEIVERDEKVNDFDHLDFGHRDNKFW